MCVRVQAGEPRCGGSPQTPPVPARGGGWGAHICHSVPPPRQGLVGQKVLRCKTIAEREIQLVKGLVAISQALKKREGGERGKGGVTFLWPFLFIYFTPSPEVGPPPLASPLHQLGYAFLRSYLEFISVTSI